MPFAAKFGRRPEELAADRELEDQLMDAYARSYGHEPTESWILIVHPDDSTEFHPFDDPSQMWCCDNKGEVRRRLGDEVRETEAAGAGALTDDAG